MIEKEETKELILSYIKENSGTKHTSNKLALNMSIPVATMRKMLNELLDDKLVNSMHDGNTKYFFIRSDAELKAREYVQYVMPITYTDAYAKEMARARESWGKGR